METAPEWWCLSLKRLLDGRKLNLMPASPLSFTPIEDFLSGGPHDRALSARGGQGEKGVGAVFLRAHSSRFPSPDLSWEVGHDEIDPGSGQIDEHDSRVAFIEAFRKWGIYPRKLRPLSGGNRCADREAKSKIRRREACNAWRIAPPCCGQAAINRTDRLDRFHDDPMFHRCGSFGRLLPKLLAALSNDFFGKHLENGLLVGKAL